MSDSDECVTAVRAIEQRLDFLEWLILHPDAMEAITEERGWFLATNDTGPLNDPRYERIYGMFRHRDGRNLVVMVPRRTDSAISALCKEADRKIAKRWPEVATGGGGT